MGLTTRLFAHGSVYAAATLLERLLGFLLIPVYAHLIGVEGYGIIQLMATLTTVFGVLFAQGLPSAWFRLRYGRADEEVEALEASIVWYLVVTTTLGVGLLAAFGDPFAAAVAPGVPFYPFVLLALVAATFEVWSNLCIMKLQAQQRPLALGSFRLVRAVLNLASIIAFVVLLRRGALGKLEGDVVAGVLIAVAVIAIVRPAGPRRASRRLLRQALAYGWPLLPHALALLVNASVDRIFLNAMLGLGAVGTYGVAFKFGSVGALVGAELNRAFTPLFMETMTEADAATAAGDAARSSALKDGLAASTLVLLTLACCICLAVCGAGRELIVLLTPEEFHDGWRALPLIALAMVAWAAYTPFGQAVMYDAATARRLVVVSISAALVNVLGNIILIPRLGILGAAWATLLSNVGLLVVGAWLAQRAVPIRHRWARWGLLIGWTSMNAVVYYVMDDRLDGQGLRVVVKLAWLIVAVSMTLVLSGDLPAIARFVRARLGRSRT